MESEKINSSNSYCFSRQSGSQREEIFLEEVQDILTVKGYQGFDVRRDGNNFSIECLRGPNKFRDIWPELKHKSAATTSILDLGCAQGEIGLQFLSQGIQTVTFVDHDAEYCNSLRRVLDFVGDSRSEVVESKIHEYRQQHDVVIALALVHWLYGATASFHSIASIVRHLRALTRQTLIIEWVDAADEAIRVGKHLDFAKSSERGEYNRNAFIYALETAFTSAHMLAKVSETREIWVATVV